MLKPDLAQSELGIESTVVVFGSARIREGHRWYDEARAFGRLASERGGALRGRVGEPRDNVIATGGGPGIMEAANRGAVDAGAPSVGFNITLPHEQEPNAYSTPELTFRFHYFAMRKMHLAMRANALVVFPGGFGTFDNMNYFFRSNGYRVIDRTDMDKPGFESAKYVFTPPLRLSSPDGAPRGRYGHWFWGPLGMARNLYLQVGVAALLTNIFAVTTSIFSMIVYDRVIPNNAQDTLVALLIGVVVVFLSDFAIRSLRGYFLDVAGARADMVIGDTLFEQILDMQMKARRGSTSTASVQASGSPP